MKMSIEKFKSALRQKEVFRMRRLCVVAVLGLLIAALAILSTSDAAEPGINMKALMAKRVPVLLEFGRGWCIPCKYMKPILDDMAQAYVGKAIVTTVDMDANKDIVRDFRIRMMPTQVFLTPEGKEFFRNEGVLEREKIMQVFAKMGVPGPSQGAVPSPVPQAMAPQAPPTSPGAARW